MNTPASSQPTHAEQHGILLEVVKLPTTKQGFVRRPRGLVYVCVYFRHQKEAAWVE